MGDVREGKPVGDVRVHEEESREPASAGTTKLALDMTGDDEGESFGNRTAAAEGDGTDMPLSPLTGFTLTFNPVDAGAMAGWATPWPFAPPPIASYRCTISEIELRRVDRLA